MSISLLSENDRMVDPLSKELCKIDDRLLMRDTWIDTPELVIALIKELSISNPENKVTRLAKIFLKIIDSVNINKINSSPEII